MRVLFIALLIVWFNVNVVATQILNNKGVQIILKGKVTDESTGEPVSVNIEFRSADGKKIRITSNSKDGSYQQVLNAGEEYEVIFTNYDIIRKKEQLVIDNYQEYTEVTKNFTVKRLVVGKRIYELQGFDNSSDKLNQTALNLLEELQEFMKFNRGVSFEIVVSGDNHYVPPKQPTAQPTQKAKKPSKNVQQTQKQEQQSTHKPNFEKNYSLASRRADAVKNQIATWQRFQNRVTVSTDLESGNTKPSSYNFVVIVSKVENH